MRKPAFANVRAPNLWNKKADGTAGELGFWTHRLDPCLYLSVREATDDDDEFLIVPSNGKQQIMDGILGLHVDDFCGGGEGVTNENDIKQRDADGNMFRGRCLLLDSSLKFGK